MSLRDIGYLFPSRLPQSLFLKAASLLPMALWDIGYLFPHSRLPQRLFVMTPIHPQPAYPPKVPTLVPQFGHTRLEVPTLAPRLGKQRGISSSQFLT
jgi:hypothetical protein